MENLKSRVCLLLNMVAPARLPLYSALAERFDLLVLHGGTEANRTSWQGTEQALANAAVKRAWGWQIPVNRKQEGEFFDRRYIHITPGYLWHLFKFRPNAIVTNEMGFRTVVALACGSLLRVPVWIWWGGTLHTERSVGRVRKALRNVICHWSRHWISYGQTSTEYLKSLGVGADRIVEIQNAVDEKRFSADATADFQVHPRPVLLCVGQLVARKGVELMLAAAAALQTEGREFSLLLVGSGRNERDLKQLATDLNLKNVHFHPEQRPNRMPSVYRSGDVLVFPTLEDVWGLVANEAVLAGLPILCSKYAGCARELFSAENIFDPTIPSEFGEKLRQALAGQLAKADASRLRTTAQLASELICALEHSMDARPAPLGSRSEEGFYQG
jgi:glycosyltransferase involved in cell wall biosynthesis